eukprot:359468-Chlamydomonas_euryale.AAC.5
MLFTACKSHAVHQSALATSSISGSNIRPNANYRTSLWSARVSYRERTHKGYACVERSKTKAIKQRAGRCHKVNATAHVPEPPHTNATPPAATPCGV